MNRFAFALVASLSLGAATSLGASADLGLALPTQVTLTCNDGHSVVLWADAATLTSLTADVSSINGGGTGLSCTLDTSAGTTSEPTDWTVYDYNPSNRALAPRNSPNSMPATTSGATTTFNFKSNIFTALLTTTDPSLDGDLATKTLSDTVTLSGDPGATFISQNGDGCNAPATARFYFVSPSASGPSTGSPPAGFYTRFWWSNPVAVPLGTDPEGPVTIEAHMFNPSEWSDWNGQNGASQPEAFTEATHKVQAIGLSFGGGCFFENGVTAINNPNNTEQFSSTFTEQ